MRKLAFHLPRSPTATSHLSSAILFLSHCQDNSRYWVFLSLWQNTWGNQRKRIKVYDYEWMQSLLDGQRQLSHIASAGRKEQRTVLSVRLFCVPFYSCVSLESQSIGWCSLHSTASLPFPANHLWSTWPTYLELCLLDDSKFSQVCNGEEPSQYRVFTFCLVIESKI